MVDPTDSQAVIAVSRLQFRWPWLILPALVRFRSLYARARLDAGFVRGQVSLAGPRTLVNVSVWKDRRQMLAWSGTAGHVVAVRWSQRHTLEVWSADACVTAVSTYSHAWSGEVVIGPLSTTLAPSGRPLQLEIEAGSEKTQRDAG